MVTTCGFTLPLLLLMNHNQHLSSSIISLTFLFKRSKSKGLTASSFKGPVPFVLGFPNGKESACQGKRCRFVAWVGKIPRKRAWQPTPVFLPGESPWTDDPGKLQSTGSQRNQHDWATNSTVAPKLSSSLNTPAAVFKIKNVTTPNSAQSEFVFSFWYLANLIQLCKV